MKRLMLMTAAALVMCLLVPLACASAPSEEASSGEIMPSGISPGRDESYKEADTEALPSTEEERMIVRNGDMSLVVEDVVSARDEIAQLAVRSNGYVVSSQISGEEQDMRGWISIRVPDEEFEQALTELRELAVRVTSESTDSRDVTEEYVDLQSRLRNAEATESQ